MMFREDVNKEWVLLKRICLKHPESFPPEKLTKDNLIKCTNILLTRAFGLGLNFTMLVPYADSWNHYNIDSGWDLFCPVLHQLSMQDLSSPSFFDAKEYQNKERMLTSFTDFYK